MAMVRKQKAVIQLMVIGCIGGWLEGACINSSDGILMGLIHHNSLKAMLVGILSCTILAFPWNLSMDRRGWWATGIFFGVLASLFGLLGYFLIWPYEGHGRTGVYKTVLALVASYPEHIFGIGGLLGLGASSWIRPTQSHERLRMDFILPVFIVGGLLGLTISLYKVDVQEVQQDPRDVELEKECCSIAYQAFVEKVGVSYASFEAMRYCRDKLGPQVTCIVVDDCLEQCAVIRKNCAVEDKVCKDTYYKCILACPAPK